VDAIQEQENVEMLTQFKKGCLTPPVQRGGSAPSWPNVTPANARGRGFFPPFDQALGLINYTAANR
jgi:hypothetical protein